MRKTTNLRRRAFVAPALVTAAMAALTSETLAGDANLARRVQASADATGAYFHCVRESAAEVAFKDSNEPVRTAVEHAKHSCDDKLGRLVNIFTAAVSAGDITDLEKKHLLAGADGDASALAIDVITAAHGAMRYAEPKIKALVNCTRDNADAMALASNEPAEAIAKAAVALCSKQIDDFLEARARVAGGSLSSGEFLQTEQLYAELASAPHHCRPSRRAGEGQTGNSVCPHSPPARLLSASSKEAQRVAILPITAR